MLKHRLALTAGLLLVTAASFAPIAPPPGFALEARITNPGAALDPRLVKVALAARGLKAPDSGLSAADCILPPGSWAGVLVNVAIDQKGRVMDASAQTTRVYQLGETEMRVREEFALPPDIARKLEETAVAAVLAASFVRLGAPEGATEGPVRGEYEIRWEIPAEGPLSSGTVSEFADTDEGRPLGILPIRTRSHVDPSRSSGKTAGTHSLDEPILIDDDVTPPELIEKVHPVYPEEARRAKAEGKVILETIIDTDGSVIDVRVLRFAENFPSLTEAAVDAVRQWKYRPSTKDGKPVKVFFTVVIEFTLR